MPAAPARAPASANATEIVRFTLIPIIADASVSWETARIAFPWRVERTNHVSTTSTGTTVEKTATLFHLIPMSQSVIASVRGLKFGPDAKGKKWSSPGMSFIEFDGDRVRLEVDYHTRSQVVKSLGL